MAIPRLGPPPFAPATPVRINLYSDTQTRPTEAMKAAMMAAAVGDEQHGDDPSITLLCQRTAALLGKEAAVFLPSGTMCNEVAILTHCGPGDEILAHESAHIASFEGGAPWALAGARVVGLVGAGGQFDVGALDAALRPASRYAAPQRLVAVEQTANLGGGTVWPLARLDAVAAWARAHGMATHMDGARLLNAAVASGLPAARIAAGYDSVWLDFTKGLGAPLGAVLAGSAPFIDAAWRWKQRLGGALRQAGLCAAGCTYALDHHVGRLAEDHANARLLAAALARIEGVAVVPPETNLVYADLAATGLAAPGLADAALAKGLLVSVMGPYLLRLCTHLDVTVAAAEEAAAILAMLIARLRPRG